MTITDLEHLYVETHEWDRSEAFWTGLGFSFVDRWGDEGHRAGRLESGKAAVVLAEVPSDRPVALNAFFALSAGASFEFGDGVDVVTPLEPTHWGTRWIRVRDPEGRVFCLETGGDVS